MSEPFEETKFQDEWGYWESFHISFMRGKALSSRYGGFATGHKCQACNHRMTAGPPVGPMEIKMPGSVLLLDGLGCCGVGEVEQPAVMTISVRVGIARRIFIIVRSGWIIGKFLFWWRRSSNWEVIGPALKRAPPIRWVLVSMSRFSRNRLVCVWFALSCSFPPGGLG